MWGSKMGKMIGRIGLWILGLICMALVCVKMVHPIVETELINSENYLITSGLKAGDVLEQSITLQREGLKSIDVAFVYEGDVPDECKALVEVVMGEEVLMQSVVQVNLMPNQSLTTFEISEGSIGDKLSLRITNISEEANSQFSFLYTDSQIRMLEYVTQYEINNQAQEGQLISQYTYRVGYDYYKALSVMFWVLIICITLDSIYKNCGISNKGYE